MPAALILALVAPATAADCAPVDTAAAAYDAVSLVLEDELEGAEARAREGIAGLECMALVPAPEDLARLWQVLGAIYVYRDMPELARPSLAQAAAVYPGWFEDDLGQPVREAWLAAAAELETASMAVWPVPGGGLLFVDGVVRPNEPFDVPAGRHFVQITHDQEIAFSRTLDLAGGQHAEIATGLPGPELGERGFSPFLLGAGAAAAGAVAAYSAGWAVDRTLEDADTVQALDRRFWVGRSLGYTAGGLALGAAVGVGLHFTVW
jgi:hypothetical protein